MLSIWDQRLKDLEEHIEQDYALMKEYEKVSRIEDDPKRRMKYRNEIESLEKSALNYQQQLEKIKSKINGLSVKSAETQVDTISLTAKLEQLETQLGFLTSTQVAICDFLGDFRQEVLNQYTMSERNMIQAITNKLEDNQVLTVKRFLSALDKNEVSESEIEQILSSTQQALIMVERSHVNLPSEQKALAKAISDPKLDSKHRLKLTIPIIPLLLSYETQLEFGTGVNLKTLWLNWSSKFGEK